MTGSLTMSGPVRRTDWAEQESSQSSGPSYPPDTKVKEPCLWKFEGETYFKAQVDHQGDAAVDPSRLPSQARPRMARTYSIATLLKIGQLKQFAHVELRISPDALTENVFKAASSSLRSKREENLRPRVYTQSSNPTGRSTTSDEATLYDASYVRPVRQPLNPPEISLIQKHAGFARFLKQHASPPHHRVTAGGRIVPAGPQSPPPMMLIPSINAVISNPSSKALGNQQMGQAETSIKTANAFKTPVAPVMGPLAPQNTNVGVQKVFESPHQATHLNTSAGNSTTSQIQPILTNVFGTNLGPLPAGATPIGFLLDGSPLVYFNGVNYQCFWNGHTTALKPLQLQTSAPPSMNYNPVPYTPMAAGSQYQPVFNSGHLNHSEVLNSSYRAGSGISFPYQHVGEPDVEDAHTLHHQLGSELTMLDKHIALHLHEFSSSENQRYTTRRRQLVEQLDILRVRKENKGSLNLASDSVYGAQNDTSWSDVNHLAGAASNPYQSTARGHVHSYLPTTPVGTQSESSQLHSFGYNHGLAPPEISANKSLSPDAPPFVPQRNQRMKPMPLGRCHIPSHPADNVSSKWEDSRTHGLASQYDRVVHSDERKPATDTRAIPSNEKQGAPTSTSRSLDTSLESHATEMLPTVTLKEIEYTKERNPNPLHGEKRYCTTIEEFQEVLRRVREQAQMYGCSGGQSKDPAYDAEQDVRWAMGDNEPIPLPMDPADHVAYPRPWNWADSAYNSNRNLKNEPEWQMDIAANRDAAGYFDSFGNKQRPKANEWRVNASSGEAKDHNGSPETFKQTKFGKQESTSGWPLWKQSPVQSGHDSAFLSNQRVTPFKAAQSSYGDQGLKTAYRLPNHQPYMESVPETPPEDTTYYRNPAFDNGFDKQVPDKDRDDHGWEKNPQSSWARTSARLEESKRRAKEERERMESDAVSFDSFLGAHDHTNSMYGKTRNAKVNLPRYYGGPEALPTATNARGQFSSDTEAAVNFAKLPSENESQGFLRGMLKSPRYSATRFHQSEPFDSMQDQMQAVQRAEQEWNTNDANKENVKSEGYQDSMFEYGRGAKYKYDAANAHQNADQGGNSNKTGSSLAASSYQATGRMPQYDGAGEEALAATSRKGVNEVRSEPKHEAISPSGAAVGMESSSRLEQAKLWDVDPSKKYDKRGLEKEDFKMDADVPGPAEAQAHCDRVDQYFDRLWNEELHDLLGQRPLLPQWLISNLGGGHRPSFSVAFASAPAVDMTRLSTLLESGVNA
ncbi:MAG: hypothetical protein Q9194_005417 [Teloschistes cf. exilis]